MMWPRNCMSLERRFCIFARSNIALSMYDKLSFIYHCQKVFEPRKKENDTQKKRERYGNAECSKATRQRVLVRPIIVKDCKQLQACEPYLRNALPPTCIFVSGPNKHNAPQLERSQNNIGFEFYELHIAKTGTRGLYH